MLNELCNFRLFSDHFCILFQLRDLKLMKTLAGKRVVGPRSSKGKNKPPSVSAQFNVSVRWKH